MHSLPPPTPSSGEGVCSGRQPGGETGRVPGAVSGHGRLPAPTPRPSGWGVSADAHTRAAVTRCRHQACAQPDGGPELTPSGLPAPRPPPLCPCRTPLPDALPSASPRPTLQGPEHTPSSRKASCTTSTHVAESGSPSASLAAPSGGGEGGGGAGGGRGGFLGLRTARWRPDSGQRLLSPAPRPRCPCGAFRPPPCAGGPCPAAHCGDNPEGPVSGQRGPTGGGTPCPPYARWCLRVGGLSLGLGFLICNVGVAGLHAGPGTQREARPPSDAGCQGPAEGLETQGCRGWSFIGRTAGGFPEEVASELS